MPGLRELSKKWLQLAGIGLDPFASAVRKARITLSRIARRGMVVPDEISRPVLRAAQAVLAGNVTAEIEQEFYIAYSRIARLVSRRRTEANGEPEQPFEDALKDSQLLLKHASESGVAIDKAIVEPLLAARTALATDTLNDSVRATFYEAYTRLARLFGDVTAETIRNCSSPETKRALIHDRNTALTITFVIAVLSVIMFVMDAMSAKIVADIASANASAASLRAALTPPGTTMLIDPSYADDPCSTLKTRPTDANAPTVRDVKDVEELQQFAATIRDLNGRTVKLNSMLIYPECGPYSKCWASGHNKALMGRPQGGAESELQLNPAILNYTGEVLCKIRTYQGVRTFATNVQEDYMAVIGAFASYALPIVYALLGAYAFRLRLFAETIKKRTYHPSFSDSARMITAVIAGAICGIINPAKGLALSPLATAFLVGYGVELFFRFLDTLINAFGSPPVAGQRAANDPSKPLGQNPA
jgi:hypothetical protein